MIKIQLDSDDWMEIQDAMFKDLQKCGSHPPPRFLRMAFTEACKRIGIKIENSDQKVYHLPKDVIDDIGKLVSIAACYDKDTAKNYAEKLDQVLRTEE